MGSVVSQLKSTQKIIDDTLGLSSADRFYSCVAACALVGGTIARDIGIYSPDMQRMQNFALRVIHAARVSVQGVTGGSLQATMEALTSYINENINGVLVINSCVRGAPPQAPIRELRGNALKVRYEPDTKELYIVSSDFKKYLHSKQIDTRRGLDALSSAGILMNNGADVHKRIGAGALLGVPGTVTRCLCFSGLAMGIEETLGYESPAKPAQAEEA
jgi:hypothetical protein